jgi:hypothetical protein
LLHAERAIDALDHRGIGLGADWIREQLAAL